MDMYGLFDTLIVEYGREIFSDRARALSLMRDYAPRLTGDINLFKLALGMGAYETFAMQCNKGAQEQAEFFARYRVKLNTDYKIMEEGAHQIVDWFCYIFGLSDDRKCDKSGEYTLPDGTTYKGSTEGGYPAGTGKYTFKAWPDYEGTFEQNRSFSKNSTAGDIVSGINGEGKIIYQTRDIYIGDIRHGKKHGNGTLYIARGDSVGAESYQGTWVDDVYKM